MRVELQLKALQRALKTRSLSAGLIHHSDRGSQYARRQYRQMLDAHQAACSMSRAGDCYDNAVAESVFASLTKECLSRRAFATRTEAYDAVASYIDGSTTSCGGIPALGYVSPIEYEKQCRGVNHAA